MENEYVFVGPFSQVLSLSGLPLKGAIKNASLQPIANAGILIKGNKIYKTRDFETLSKEATELKATHYPVDTEMVCLPGFVDAHTHICFAGSRANDYAMRNEGRSYLEIAEAGGGIWDSVQQTRSANVYELAALTALRANRHLSEGVTTIEVKSGYGLSVKEELKMLRAIQKAAEYTKADLLTTCLAAHTLPRDFSGGHEAYLAEMMELLFPILIAEKLTNRVDAFIEKGAFSPQMIEPYFEKAKALGFDITVHADQFSPGGSKVAVRFGAISADHLEASGDAEIKLLAKSDTIPVALPGASLGLGCAFTPARKLLDAGASLAIATDWNPGSAPMGDLLMQASILGPLEKLSHAEIFSAITFRAAAALGLHDRGRIEPVYLADFVLFPVNDYKEILYYQGKLKPEQVWKNGVRVV